MPEIRDPAIKLFGKTIALPANDGGGGHEGYEDKGHSNKESTIASKDREQESLNSEGRSEPVSADDNRRHSYDDDQEAEPENNPNAEEKEVEEEEEEEEQKDPSNPQEKTLKKPDKILPCPRCNSLDTKFCYYNNYNVNQPRHFCKNCQRYWTAGGTMRNVPVGAGRRKNKNSLASQYRHLAVSDVVGLQAIPDQLHHQSLKPKGTVLSFGPDAPPLLDSMASVLNLAEKATKNCHRRGFHRTEEQTEEQPSVSSVTPSSCNDEGAGANASEPSIWNCHGFAPQVPFLNGCSPWPFPWNPPPAICAPSYPMPFYPAAAYWGCTPWSLPWLQTQASPSPTGVSSGTGPNSPALGKHSREDNAVPTDSGSEKGDSVKQSNQEGCRLWIPKTLRIHDPEDAAKSSVWATMGFKNEKTDSGQGLFKGFQTKGELSRTHLGEASQALHANPAALSRSANFQESS